MKSAKHAKSRRFKKNNRKVTHRRINKKRNTRRTKLVKHRNKTRKVRGGSFLERLKRRFSPSPSPPPIEPQREGSFEEIDPIADAHALGKEVYQSTMDKEFVEGNYGEALRDVDSKKHYARKDAEKAVVDSYGKDTWNLVQRHFPGKPIPLPEETIRGLTTVLPPAFWEQTLPQFKFKSKLEKNLFMKTVFSNEETYEIKEPFLNPNITSVEVRQMVDRQYEGPAALLPFEKKNYTDEQISKIKNKVVKKVEGFITFYQDTLKKNILQNAIAYWKNPSLGNQNYKRTKNAIIERFGETYWTEIAPDFKREIQSSLNPM